MTEHARNVAVGITVILALVLLGTMILLFAGLPEMFQTGQVIRMDFPNTGGLIENSPVNMAGKRVGRVTAIGFVEDDPRKGIEMVARLDPGVPVPADVQPTIYTALFGAPVLSLDRGGPKRTDPRTGAKLDFLPRHWTQPLQGTLRSPSLLPPDLTSSLADLGKVARGLASLVSEPDANAPPAAADKTLAGAIARLSRSLEDIHTVLGDPNNQANIRTALANIAKASAKAGEALEAFNKMAQDAQITLVSVREAVKSADGAVGDVRTAATQAVGKIGALADNTDRNVGDLTRKLIGDAEQISKVLAALQETVAKMNSGDGSAGKLLNDPKLYGNLLEASDELTRLMRDFRGLLETWKKEGLPLKLK
jgi:phospholipid/cholesterol/gamma-HCH transport system substrate-binding protein